MFEWALWFLSFGDWLFGPKLWWVLAGATFLVLGQVPFISRSLSLALALGVLSLGYQSHAFNLGWYGHEAAIERSVGKTVKKIKPPVFKNQIQKEVEKIVPKAKKQMREIVRDF